jgi:succinoglycan biosynthesis protein ExoA
MTKISVVVPMLNEAEHVEQFVADLASQDFAGEVEVIVADGDSTDGSVDRLNAAAAREGVTLQVVPNASGWVSQGLNACVEQATGELVVRLDCHSRYPPDYLRLCAETADETGAMAVGGIVAPEGRTPTERAVAAAMDSPFGGIGWMRGTSRPTRRDSDILTYGAFRPETFAAVGLFDESLRRNQDDDFTFRIRRAGGRVVLDSRIQVRYVPRGSYGGVFRQYFHYGYWKVAVMRKHGRMLSARSAAPPAFVASLVVLGAAAIPVPAARWALAADVGAYAAGATAFAALSMRRRREPWSLLPRVAATFPAFHVGYGVGVFAGFLRTIRERRPRRHAAGAEERCGPLEPSRNAQRG